LSAAQQNARSVRLQRFQVTTTSADLAWYTALSRERGLPARCPFASVHRCPRYFQSVALLEESVTTKMDSGLRNRLEKRWMASELWPVNSEQSTAITYSGNAPSTFTMFCPEVTGDTYGRFVEAFARYADEIDSERAYKRLAAEHADSNDWRWYWSYAQPLHYSDCALYSLLSHGRPIDAAPDEILELKPGAFGFAVNLKAGWRRFAPRLPKRLRKLLRLSP
jgi:hypothetical protein